jgi:5-methylcytosine-specific restriction endonuclease McrA
VSCSAVFTGRSSRCWRCWWQSLPPEARQTLDASRHNARRALRLGAEIAGPVPPEVYVAIRGSGPCVYCGEEATAVDHVRPLTQGGWEHESNLAPACLSCNSSKKDRLLTEWLRADRVAYGVEHSPKVADEYARLTLAVLVA